MKGDLETALGQLKEAHKSQDIAAIDAAMSNLNEKWQKASTEMYQGTQGGQQQPGAGPESQGPRAVSSRWKNRRRSYRRRF